MTTAKKGAVIGGIVVFFAATLFGYAFYKGMKAEGTPLDLENGLMILGEALFLACIGAGIGAGLGYLWDRIKP